MRLPALLLLLPALLLSACGDTSSGPTSPTDGPAVDTTSTDSSPSTDTHSEEPAIGYATPEYCGSCHPAHYEQWRGSMHAYAVKDPVFEAMVAKGIEDTKGKLDQFCVQCHAPSASLKEQMPVHHPLKRKKLAAGGEQGTFIISHFAFIIWH